MTIARTARAEDAAALEPAPAIQALLFEAGRGMGAAGDEGRWGIAFERHPGVRDGERGGGLGIGYGLAAGFAIIGGGIDERNSSNPAAGGWIAPVLRPGWYFGVRRKDRFASACLGVGLRPTLDVLGDGSVRLTLSSQPGFLLNFQHFAFGFAMNVGGTALASGPRDELGLAVGVLFHLGAAL